jgi:malonyl-CoA/methylmalonyl-CoA synthetase
MKMADNYLFDGLLAGKLDSEDRRNALFAILPDDGRRYSYGDVEDVSGRFANVLVDLGVRPGDRVAVQAPKSIEAIMLYLAVVRAGAVFLPLNTGYTPAEIEYFLGNATPRIFVCDPKQLADYEALTARLGIGLETMGVWQNHETSAGSLNDAGLAAPTAFETVARSAGDLAAILYTSGTTGRSKGAMLSHANLLSNAQTLVDVLALHQRRCALACAADLPHPRPVRRHQRGAERRCVADLPARLLRRGDHRQYP